MNDRLIPKGKTAGLFTCHLVYDTSDPDHYGEFIPTDPDGQQQLC